MFTFRIFVQVFCVLVLLSACASTPQDQRYRQALQSVRTQGDKASFSTMRTAFLTSEKLLARVQEQNRLLGLHNSLVEKAAGCSEKLPLLQAMLEQNYTNLNTHRLAMTCAAELGNAALQVKHEAALSGLIEAMLQSGSGDNNQQAIVISTLADPSAFLQLGGYRVLSYRFEQDDARDVLLYIALVDDADGKQKQIYFDATTFIANYAMLASANEQQRTPVEAVNWALRVFADQGDDDAQIAVGDAFWYYGGDKNREKAIKYYQAAADKGNVFAMIRLASRYENGAGVTADGNKAMEFLAAAAEKGYADAELWLAQRYEQGRHVDRNEQARDALIDSAAKRIGRAEALYRLSGLYLSDDEKRKDDARAFYWVNQAAVLDHPAAITSVGWMIQVGRGTAKDEVKALEYFRRAAGSKYADAMWRMGRAHQYGWGTEKNPVEALTWFERAAAQGDPDALHRLSEMYNDGEQLTSNPVKARELAEQAARLGHIEAMCDIGYYRSVGQGGVKNLLAAFRWYYKGSIKGNAQCQYNLAHAYDKGRGTTQDYKAAAFWYQLAVNKEYSFAYSNLGLLYESGLGVEKSVEKAVELFRQGAEHNNANAMRQLGRMYSNGNGLVQSHTEALTWFIKSAEAGDTEGQRRAGLMYRDGLGVPVDLKEARRWLSMAANQGDADAITALRALGGAVDITRN